MSLSENNNVNRLLENREEEIMEEYSNRWKMSGTGPNNENENLDRLRDFSVEEVLSSKHTQLRNVRISRKDPHETDPDKFEGTAVVEMYPEEVRSIEIGYDLAAERTDTGGEIRIGDTTLRTETWSKHQIGHVVEDYLNSPDTDY